MWGFVIGFVVGFAIGAGFMWYWIDNHFKW